MKRDFLSSYRLATENVDQFCTRLKGLYEDLCHHPGSILPTEICKTFLMNVRADLTQQQKDYNVGRLDPSWSMTQIESLLPFVRCEFAAGKEITLQNA